MKLGFDFDNTIVRYDALFHRVACEQGYIATSVPVNKTAVRDFLRASGKEAVWTQMQGYVYGARMQEAEVFPDALAVLRELRDAGHTLFIVSHKTRRPYLGPAYDLHASARAWIVAHLLDVSGQPLIPSTHIFFHEKKEEKIARIATLECDVFLDDLPEILQHEHFSAHAARFLLAEEPPPEAGPFTVVSGWRAFAEALAHGSSPGIPAAATKAHG